MSTETAPAPVETPAIENPIPTPENLMTDTKVVTSTTGNPTINLGTMADLLSKGNKNFQAPKEPEKTPEPVVEKKTDPEPVKEQPKGKDDNMANLRKLREAAEKERDDFRTQLETLKAEFETFKSKPFELPEEHKTKYSQLEQERDTYLKELRVTNLARDPEFVQKYEKGIQSNIETMQKIAKESGVSDADLRSGFGAWSENAFGQWMEEMSPGQKVKFQAAWLQTEQLHNERTQKLQDAEKTYSELMQSREAQAKAQYESGLEKNTSLAKVLVKKLVLDAEGTKEWEDLPAAAEAMAMKAARYEMTPEEVLTNLIHNQVLARVKVKNDNEIVKLKEQMAERDKKIADLEKFVAEHSGATPQPTAGIVPAQSQEKGVLPWQNMIIRPNG